MLNLVVVVACMAACVNTLISERADACGNAISYSSDEFERLAKKDLLTAPESGAILADAREARGDIEPALRTHDRCARTAANRVVQCARTPAHAASR